MRRRCQARGWRRLLTTATLLVQQRQRSETWKIPFLGVLAPQPDHGRGRGITTSCSHRRVAFRRSSGGALMPRCCLGIKTGIIVQTDLGCTPPCTHVCALSQDVYAMTTISFNFSTMLALALVALQVITMPDAVDGDPFVCVSHRKQTRLTPHTAMTHT